MCTYVQYVMRMTYTLTHAAMPHELVLCKHWYASASVPKCAPQEQYTHGHVIAYMLSQFCLQYYLPHVCVWGRNTAN